MKLRVVSNVTSAIVLSSALAACGGGGTQALSPTPHAATSAPVTPKATTVSFTVTFPARAAAAASARHRNYISPSIQSLTIAIDGATPVIVNAPAPANTPQTVTTKVDAPAGSDLFAIEEFDQTNGLGNELGKVSMMSNVVQNTDNTIALTVDGELAKIAIQAVPSPFLEGTLAAGYTLVGYAAQTFVAVPQDFDGNTIVSPGAVPGITVSSAGPAIVEAQTANANTFTLQAPAPTANVAITAAGKNLEGATVMASFNAKAIGAFYIADYFVQKIRVFDENGTPLVLPAAAFPALTNPMGLAFVPGTNPRIVATETSNFQQPFVVNYDLSGNAIAFSSSAFAGLSQPLFLGYGNGQLFVPNFYTAKLSVFDTFGNAATPAAGSYSKLLDPVAVAYDPDNQQTYVTNTGNDTITTYSAAGALLATATTGSKPMGVTYDPNNKSLYVAFAGTLGGALNAPAAQAATPGGIDEFTAALAPVTNTGGFAVSSTASYFTGMAFDAYTKTVYAADSGMSKIDAFTETGAAVTLPTGAFSTISATNVPPSEPQAILFVP